MLYGNMGVADSVGALRWLSGWLVLLFAVIVLKWEVKGFEINF